MPATLAQLLSVRSRLAEEAIEFLERFAEAVDRTPWEFCGKKVKASSAFIEPIVLTQREIREEDDTHGRKAQRQSFGGSTVSLTDEMLMKQYERTRLSGKHEEKRWSQVLRAVGGLRLVVTGEPGGGKTCATRCTAAQVARESVARLRGHESDVNEVTFPLWLMATDAAKLPDSIDLPDALLSASLAHPALAGAVSPFLRNWLRKRVCGANSFIVIDALDEVPTPERNEVFLRRLGELGRTAASVAITCRTLPWERLKVCVPWQDARLTVELKPLDPLHQREHAEAFLAFLGCPDLAEEMDRRFTRDLPLREHARTPLILTFACGLLAEGELPAEASLAKLYRLVIDALLEGRWRKAVARPPWAEKSIQRDRVRLFLGPLGWKLFRASPDGNRYSLPQWDEAWTAAAALAKAPANDSDALLDDLLTLGLLIDGGKDESGNACVSFAHRTVLEFLAAEGLREDKEQLRWLLLVQKPIEENPFWFHPEWLPTLTFLAAIMGDATSLIEAVELPPLLDGKPAPFDDIFCQMLGLQCQFAGAAKATPTHILEVIVRNWRSVWGLNWWRPRSRVGYYDMWVGYGSALAGHPSFQSVFSDRFIQAMEEEDTYEMCYSAWFLHRLGARGFLSTILKRLRIERHQNKRAYLMRVLETLNDKESADTLLGELDREKDGYLRTRLVELLGTLNDLRATPLIIAILAAPFENWLWHSLAHGIEALGDPKLIGPLFDRLERETDSQTRYYVTGAIASLLRQQSIEHLAANIAHENSEVARRVVGELGESGDARAVDILVGQLSVEERSDVVAAIASALGTLRAPKCIPPLLHRLERENDSYAKSCIDKAVKECTRQSEELALRKTSSSIAEVERGIRALGKKLKSEKNMWKRGEIVAELGATGEPYAAKMLLSHLKHEKLRWVRKDIAEALGAIGDLGTLHPLLLHLRGKEHKDVRRSVMETIFKLAIENKIFIPIPEEDCDLATAQAFAASC